MTAQFLLMSRAGLDYGPLSLFIVVRPREIPLVVEMMGIEPMSGLVHFGFNTPSIPSIPIKCPFQYLRFV